MFDRDYIDPIEPRRKQAAAFDLDSSFIRRMGCNVCRAPRAPGDRHYCAKHRREITERSWDAVSKEALR